MRTKKEIQEKLKEAETAIKNVSDTEQTRLGIVVITLRWVLSIKITHEPIDPIKKG